MKTWKPLSLEYRKLPVDFREYEIVSGDHNQVGTSGPFLRSRFVKKFTNHYRRDLDFIQIEGTGGLDFKEKSFYFKGVKSVLRTHILTVYRVK